MGTLGVGRDAVVLCAVLCPPLASCCWATRSELNGHQGSHHQYASQPAAQNLVWNSRAGLEGPQEQDGRFTG